MSNNNSTNYDQGQTSKVLVDTAMFFGINYIGYELVKSPKPSISDTVIYVVADFVARNYDWAEMKDWSETARLNGKISLYAFLGMFAKDIIEKKQMSTAFVNSLVKAGLAGAGNEILDRNIAER